MDRDEELEAVVTLLAGAVAGLPDSESGSIISASGIGSNAAGAYVNDTFALRDFCWCEGRYHPETVDDDHPGFQDAIESSGGTSTGCPPNFEHFSSGVTATWYKHLGRDTEFNRYAKPGEALEILRDCLVSLPAGHLLGLGSVELTQKRRQWGWTR